MPSGLALVPEFVTILTLKGRSADSIPVIASSWSPGHELCSHSPLLSPYVSITWYSYHMNASVT